MYSHTPAPPPTTNFRHSITLERAPALYRLPLCPHPRPSSHQSPLSPSLSLSPAPLSLSLLSPAQTFHVNGVMGLGSLCLASSSEVMFPRSPRWGTTSTSPFSPAE